MLFIEDVAAFPARSALHNTASAIRAEFICRTSIPALEPKATDFVRRDAATLMLLVEDVTTFLTWAALP
jgi:hypothetical protein